MSGSEKDPNKPSEEQSVWKRRRWLRRGVTAAGLLVLALGLSRSGDLPVKPSGIRETAIGLFVIGMGRALSDSKAGRGLAAAGLSAWFIGVFLAGWSFSPMFDFWDRQVRIPRGVGCLGLAISSLGLIGYAVGRNRQRAKRIAEYEPKKAKLVRIGSLAILIAGILIWTLIVINLAFYILFWPGY